MTDTTTSADELVPLGHTVVKVDNELNHLDYSRFTRMEMNLFTALCAQLVEEESNTIMLNSAQIRKLTGFKSTSNARLQEMVWSTYERITDFSVTYRNEKANTIVKGHLFSTYTWHENTNTLEVSVNPDVSWVLNDLENAYTMYLLPDFVGITNIYAKIMYMNLMQWRASTARLEFSLETLQKLLHYPDDYTGSVIQRRVLGPIRKQLAPLLKNFTVETVRRSHRIVGFIFSFDRMERLPNTTKLQEKRIGELKRIADAKKEAKKPKLSDVPHIPLFNISEQPYDPDGGSEQTELDL